MLAEADQLDQIVNRLFDLGLFSLPQPQPIPDICVTFIFGNMRRTGI